MDADLAPAPDILTRVDLATLCLINQERAKHGLAPLAPNAQLGAAAQRHSDDMVAGNYFAHISPTGETPLERVRATGYLPAGGGYQLGENIAWGTLSLSTPRAVVAAWIASPEHLANILDGNYRETGVAAAAAVAPSLSDGQAGAMYSQEFGVVQQG